MSTPSRTWPVLREIPDAMTAVAMDAFGPPEVLVPRETAMPVARPGEVLVQVAAVSVGRLLDLTARAGNHPYATFTFPHVLGAEHTGLVAATGDDVTGFALGDRVAAFPVLTCGECRECQSDRDELCGSLEIIGTHCQGGYAQYTVVPASNLHHVPDGLDPVEACTVALGGAVAMNQFSRAGAEDGDWVVVQAASSALGSITAELARHLGYHVIVTSRDAGKRAQLEALGFEHVLDGTADDFSDQVRELIVDGADVVVDNIGDPALWANSQAALRRGGTIVTSGAFRGRSVTVNLQQLYSLGQRLQGVRTANRSSFRRIWAEAERGFRPPAATTFELTEAAAAHHYLEADRNVGRVILITR